MCGIAGVHRFEGEPITGEEIVLLLCSLEHRGRDATGIALVNPDGIHVLKAAVPAWQFTRSKEFETFIEEFLLVETETAILHTRWATTGSPKENDNNHPMWDGQTAVVHNGMISNHTQMFFSDKYKRSCETDSDIIRAIISEHGMSEKGCRELCKLSGSAAIACVSTRYPHKLLLARSGSPLDFGFTEDGNKLFWASEAQAILRAARPWHKVRGADVQATKVGVEIGSMPDNTAWLFGEKEIEWHHAFNVCNWQYHAPDYSKGRENYHSKTKHWKRELRRKKKEQERAKEAMHSIRRIAPAQDIKVLAPPKKEIPPGSLLTGAVVQCPSCGAGNKNPDGMPWSRLTCFKCDASLG